jgi:hypothetical protein
VRSPFRSEARAFWFVPAIAAAAVLVGVTDAFAPTALTVAEALVVVAALASFYLFVGRPPARLPAAPPHVGPATERRLLLVVDDPPDEASLAALRGRADRVLVLSPAATSALHHWTSDVDRAREHASERVEAAVARLRDLQIEAAGVVGDDDTFAAIDDALRTFGGDEIAVASGDDRVLASLRARYAIPVAPLGAA